MKVSLYIPDELYERVKKEYPNERLSTIVQNALKMILPQLPKCPMCGQEIPEA